MSATPSLFSSPLIWQSGRPMKKIGKMSLRMDPALLAALQTVAQRENRSVSGQAIHYIEAGLHRSAAPPDPPAESLPYAAERGPDYKINRPKP